MKEQIRKKISPEALLMLIFVVVLNVAAYYGARAIAADWQHYDVALPLDAKIPLIPWTVIIYFGCYIFWGVNYIVCAAGEGFARSRLFCADALAKILCFAIFLVFPSTAARPEVDTSGFWGYWMGYLYEIDTPDNLFPSIHCMVSWICWIGVRKRKDIPVVYRWLSLLMALAVCVATLTTKQHVIVDVIGGVAVAELCYWIAGFAKVTAVYDSLLAKILKLFRK